MVTTVVCVLKSGGDFDVGHVARLAHQVRAHSPRLTKFICLTDQPDKLGADMARPLRHDWPGWWSKIEALAMPGPALYMDLDVSILGDLTPLLEAAAEHDLIALKDFWVDGPHRLNSSLLGWRGDLSAIYREFAEAPKAFMSLYSSKERWGDQRFISDTYQGEPTHWQNLLPGVAVSFKRGALMGEALGACLVLCSHGKPRPWDSGGADEWLRSRNLKLAKRKQAV